MKRLKAILLCAVLSFDIASAAKHDPASAVIASVPDSPAGFSQQYQPLFSAWIKKDNRRLDTLLGEFAIPNEWFVETFGDEQGRELGRLYAEQFDDLKLHISRDFAMAAGFATRWVQDKYRGSPAQLFIETSLSDNAKLNPPPKPPPESLQPLPAIQRFSTQSRLRVRNEEKNVSLWMDSYLYIDGRFRFAGRGGYPFWDAARVRLADPCAKPGEQTGGKLIKRVEPDYPELAKQERIQGTVTARLTMDTDGSVKTVEITGGPPELVDAATKAFQQWQYTPFLNCGKPVEMRSMEHIKFSLQ